MEVLAGKLGARTGGQMEHDALVGAGLLAVNQAALSFDPDRGAKFWTFAYHRVKGAMLDRMRASDVVSRTMRKRIRDGHVDEPRRIGDVMTMDLPSPSTPLSIDAAHVFETAGRLLGDRARRVLELTFRDGLTFAEVGRRLGFSESRACQIVNKSLNQLRRWSSPAEIKGPLTAPVRP